MRQEVLTETGLNDLLSSFLTRLENSYYSAAYPLFETLYHHGFRIRELEQVHEWEITNKGKVIAPTSKGSSPRKVNANQLHPLVIQSINDSTNYLYRSSYRTYRQYFKNMKGCLSLQVGKKSINTHIFRHNLVKQLSLNGITDQQIQNHLGLKNLSVVAQYKNSQIVATYIS